jgi:hypothetical protein
MEEGTWNQLIQLGDDSAQLLTAASAAPSARLQQSRRQAPESRVQQERLTELSASWLPHAALLKPCLSLVLTTNQDTHHVTSRDPLVMRDSRNFRFDATV